MIPCRAAVARLIWTLWVDQIEAVMQPEFGAVTTDRRAEPCR